MEEHQEAWSIEFPHGRSDRGRRNRLEQLQADLAPLERTLAELEAEIAKATRAVEDAEGACRGLEAELKHLRWEGRRAKWNSVWLNMTERTWAWVVGPVVSGYAFAMSGEPLRGLAILAGGLGLMLLVSLATTDS